MTRTIGILGGGQLGRMIALEAKRMGFDVITLDPTENSPCGQVADAEIVAEYDDVAAITRLGERCDVVTFEFENIPQASVHALEVAGYAVFPGSGVLARTQDRLLEKRFVQSCGIDTAPFAAVDGIEDLDAALAGTGLPAVIKTRRGGYDGKGQWRVATHQAARAAVEEAAGAPLIVEGMVDFSAEVSMIATRDRTGAMIFFPLIENMHDQGILALSLMPAQVDPALAERAAEIARRIGEGLDIVGTFAVECFVVGEHLLVNEIAPRVHNSGHATFEATTISQFEAHVRAVCGLPLAQPRLIEPAAMVNIIGTGEGNVLAGADEILHDINLRLHLYGKTDAQDRRKMGHFTVRGGTIADARRAAEHARAMLTWSRDESPDC